MLTPLLTLPLLLAAPAACPKIPEPGGKLATVDGKALTRAEVDGRIAEQLCKARLDYAQKQYELREQAVNALIDERLLAAEAKKRGLKSVGELEARLAAETPRVDEQQARQLYEENKDRVDGQPYEALRDRILASLAEQNAQLFRGALLQRLRKEHKVELALEPIRVPVDTKGPSRGPATAPVTIVIFADFQCPYCSRGASAVEEARKRHPNDVRVVYKDYPLGFHDQARPSAVAARCAGQQSRFWEMHDKLFAAQQALGPDTYRRLAGELKLDVPKWERCLSDPSVGKAVDADFAAGEAAGVDGTPAFYINGVKLSGAQPVDAFEAIIGPELARKKRK